VIVEKIAESFGKCWKIGMAKIGENIMVNGLSYLNYNLKIKDETQIIYKRQKLKSYE
jgi:UDP-3-O-[3-hydroxymyristoyl] glucosamine N-acyltransferase